MEFPEQAKTVADEAVLQHWTLGILDAKTVEALFVAQAVRRTAAAMHYRRGRMRMPD